MSTTANVSYRALPSSAAIIPTYMIHHISRRFRVIEEYWSNYRL